MAGFSFGTSTTSAPAFSLGNTSTSTTPGFNFPSATSGTPAQQVQFNSPAATQGGLSFSTPATTANTGFSFGSTGGLGQSGGLTFGTPTSTQQPALSFGGATATTGLSFGSAATSNQPNLPTFGSTATAGQSTLPTFGSTATSVQSTLPTFGSAATAGQPTLPTFGSTAATSGQSTLPTFGSTAAATAQPTLPTFGSTATTGQPTLPTFGSTATSGQSTLPTFGSSAPATSQTLTFGTPAATTQPSLSFGTTPATTQASLSFGPPATTAQQTLGFGLTAPAATTTASTGFSLGTPASTASGLTFGLGGAKPATTTAAPSLLNFAAPKTTATTGFSVSGTTTGTSSLFSLPTSAPATATTTATTPFKGLGGVDTSTTQGSGQKDAKSAKENVVNPEIMQTLDVFKNFVKQQKTLSCEVSRAPVKPMHKVTEDADALKNLLTSVSSTLQKNRVFANKLKNDTTKCLSLCEMAQRTHDTPPGLQNDNVAPLEFFIQLVSKFERDIQLLRQEIDNTEKHVTSLSHPAILTPQELSVALRRLHDSFVALAGRLQTAHAGVIAQKERHLSLRRHFLKDSTNIFDSTSRTTAKKSQSSSNLMPMPGPTPFSSLGGLPNLNLVASQDKGSTFSTGNTTLPAWGSSAIPGLSSNTSSLLQSPGTGLLTSPQPVDNQSFQLGKPPPGNKRGKR